MRNFKLQLVAGLAAISVASIAQAAESGVGGFIETGYVTHMWPGTGNEDVNSFHAREANFHLGGKFGDTEGYAEMAFGAGSNPGLFYGYIPATRTTHYGLALNEANVTFHPGFLGGDAFWKWGLYAAHYGYEGTNSSNNAMLGRSFNWQVLAPTYALGTSIGKNFGLFNVHFDLINSLADQTAVATSTTTGVAVPLGNSALSMDNNNAPGLVLGFGAGSHDTFFLDFNFGHSAIDNNVTKGPRNLIDATIGANALGALTAQVNFDYVMQRITSAAHTSKGWGISAHVGYKVMDDVTVNARFDYMKDKDGQFATEGRSKYGLASDAGSDLGFAIGAGYHINKNVTAKAEYAFMKPKLDTATATTSVKPEHLLAWTAVLNF